MSYFRPRYDRWFRTIIVGVPTVTFTLGIAYLAIGDWDAGAALLGVGILVSAIYWSVLPRAYVVQADRLRVVLGWPWGLSLPFRTIDEIRPARWIDALAYWGLRFTPSVRTPVQVKRNRDLSVVISPSDREQFLEVAQEALEAYRSGSGYLLGVELSRALCHLSASQPWSPAQHRGGQLPECHRPKSYCIWVCGPHGYPRDVRPRGRSKRRGSEQEARASSGRAI